MVSVLGLQSMKSSESKDIIYVSVTNCNYDRFLNPIFRSYFLDNLELLIIILVIRLFSNVNSLIQTTLGNMIFDLINIFTCSVEVPNILIVTTPPTIPENMGTFIATMNLTVLTPVVLILISLVYCSSPSLTRAKTYSGNSLRVGFRQSHLAWRTTV